MLAYAPVRVLGSELQVLALVSRAQALPKFVSLAQVLAAAMHYDDVPASRSDAIDAKTRDAIYAKALQNDGWP